MQHARRANRRSLAWGCTTVAAADIHRRNRRHGRQHGVDHWPSCAGAPGVGRRNDFYDVAGFEPQDRANRNRLEGRTRLPRSECLIEVDLPLRRVFPDRSASSARTGRDQPSHANKEVTRCL